MSCRIGMDIGRTFTAYVLLDDRSGELLTHPQPADHTWRPAEGALRAVKVETDVDPVLGPPILVVFLSRR